MIQPISLKNRDGKSTTFDVGRTLRVSQIPDDTSNTLIDPKILKNGTKIDLPVTGKDIFGREISKIYVPPVSFDGRLEKSGEIVFLHPVTITANQILLYLHLNSENLNGITLKSLIDTYYSVLIKRVSGNRGLIARNIGGTRMPFSGRLVLLPQIDRSPEWAGISASAMKSLRIKEGEMVIVFRDPVIWNGSMDVVRAYPIDEDVVRLHPLLFPQLGADCDGDQICFVKPPNEKNIQKEMAANLLRFAKETARWPKHLCFGGMSDVPDWDNILEDTKKRFPITGLSYGPRDIAGWRNNPTSVVSTLEAITGKVGQGEYNKKIATDPDTRRKHMLMTNYANLFMKGYLGVVGATARRVLVVMGQDPWLVEAANRFSETIQQSTLDAKHKVGVKKETVNPIDIMDLFERRSSLTIHKAVDLLVRADVDLEDAKRIIVNFRFELPIQLFLETNFSDDPEVVTELRSFVRKTITDENGNCVLDFNPDLVISLIQEKLSKKLGRDFQKKEVLSEISTYLYGMTDIVNYFYPMFALASKQSTKTREMASIFYSRLFHDEKRDRNSIFMDIL